MLRQWAEDKYHLPWTHESIQELSLLELLTAFWEDIYRKKPLEAKRKGPHGEVVFETGDPLIDKWEQEVAAGLVPDLYEALPRVFRERAQKADAKAQRVQQIAEEAQVDPEGFSDIYQ